MKVIVMMGVSGAGKSWLVDKLKELGTVRVCSADHYFNALAAKRNTTYDGVFDPKLLPEAHGVCFKSFLGACHAGEGLIVVDNTCTRESEIAPYILAAESYGYETQVNYVECPPALAAKRGKAPEAVVYRQHARLMQTLADLPPWWNLTVNPFKQERYS